MGHSPRPRPARLSEKLLAIRQCLGHIQTGMCKALGLEIDYSAISNYELGTREPPLPVILKYARLAGISTDFLIDDDLDLPERLPTGTKHEWIMRRVRPTQRR
jgi:transcriptional regulator with XRE-family HTH domain